MIYHSYPRIDPLNKTILIQMGLCILFSMFHDAAFAQDEIYLDPSFGVNGEVLFNDSTKDQFGNVELQSSGKIVYFGFNRALPSLASIFRFNTDGSLDSTFGNNGKISFVDDSTTFISGAHLRVFDDDRFIVVFYSFGSLTFPNTALIQMHKFLPDGQPDLSFSDDGYILLADNSVPYDVLINDNQSFYVAGQSYDDLSHKLYYVSQNGTIDFNFASEALEFVSAQYDESTVTILKHWGENIVITSLCKRDWGYQCYATTFRINSAGELQYAFGNNGTVEVNVEYQPNFYHFPSDAHILPNNNLLILLSDNSGSAMLKINELGALVEGYGNSLGLNYDFNFPNSCNTFYDFFVDPVGNLFAHASTDVLFCPGIAPDTYHIAQIDAQGYVVAMNTPDGTIDIPGAAIFGRCVFQPDGKLIVGGFRPNPIEVDYYLARLDFQSVVHVDEQAYLYKNTLSAYPNPTSGPVNITFALPPGFRDTQTELIVVDLTGREVHREALSAFALTSGALQIDLSAQPAGVYLAQWVSGITWLDSVKIIRE
jgi:uncharacterized delta-60 repeat protein